MQTYHTHRKPLRLWNNHLKQLLARFAFSLNPPLGFPKSYHMDACPASTCTPTHWPSGGGGRWGRKRRRRKRDFWTEASRTAVVFICRLAVEIHPEGKELHQKKNGGMKMADKRVWVNSYSTHCLQPHDIITGSYSRQKIDTQRMYGLVPNPKSVAAQNNCCIRHLASIMIS